MTAPRASGGDLLADALHAVGTPALFTLCGGHISPLVVGARRAGVRVVDVRHEAAAVFAADATARLTGKPGVAAVTAGPGVTNGLTALQNARLAQTPVVLLAGAAPTALRGRGALQDIDQLAAVRPHVKWARSAGRVRDLVPLFHRAFAAASEGIPGPALLECPVDLLYHEDVVRERYATGTDRTPRSLRGRLERWYLRRHLDRLFAPGAAVSRAAPAAAVPVPAARSVRAAGVRLARAERPVLLIGSQALADPGAAPTVAASVAALGMPTFLSGMARGLLGRRHPLLRRHARRDALREADLVILAGVPCDFRLDYGRHISSRATVVAANRSRAEARRNRRPQVMVLGDAGRFLTALAESAPSAGPWRAWHARLAARDTARDAEIDARARAPGDRVNPIALLRGVEQLAGERATFVLDGGDFAATASYVVAPRAPLHHLDPGVFGTLGVGGGFAVAAALARPASETWALFGDGAVGYSLAEFDTFVRHGLPVIAVVGNDRSWAQIAREQVAVFGDAIGTELGDTDYDAVARGLGAAGLAVDRTAEVPDVLAEAVGISRAGRPVLVNARLDPTDFRKGSISM